MRFERNQILLAGIEDEAGVLETLTGANAIKCGIASAEVDGKQLNDPYVRNSISAEPERFVNKTVRISIPVAVKGSGAAGTVPEFGPLLRACALKQDIILVESTPTKVEYTPRNKGDEMETCSIYLYKDGLVIQACGCMGELSFMGQAGEFAMFNFEMQGKFVTAKDEANPTPTYQNVDPVEVKSAGFAFGAWADAVARSFGFNTGNTLVSRPNVNAADGLEPYLVTARDPRWQARIEAVLEDDNTFWADYIARDTSALAFAHGSEAGNIVEFAAAKANFAAPRTDAEDSILIYDLGGQLLETSGEDNFKITIK